MKFLLDTNVLSDILRQNQTVLTHLTKHHPTDMAMSCISEGELLYGVAHNPEATSLRKAVEELIKSITPLPWNSAAANRYGQLKAELQRVGQTLSELDMMIAAHALSASLCLITSDRAFSRIAGLDIVNWRVIAE